MNTRVIYFFYLYLCWATVVYSEKRMRARERGSEGVGLGYGDIGFMMFTTKLYRRLVKSIEKGGREQERDREGGRQRVR